MLHSSYIIHIHGLFLIYSPISYNIRGQISYILYSIFDIWIFRKTFCIFRCHKLNLSSLSSDQICMQWGLNKAQARIYKFRLQVLDLKAFRRDWTVLLKVQNKNCGLKVRKMPGYKSKFGPEICSILLTAFMHSTLCNMQCLMLCVRPLKSKTQSLNF